MRERLGAVDWVTVSSLGLQAVFVAVLVWYLAELPNPADLWAEWRERRQGAHVNWERLEWIRQRVRAGGYDEDTRPDVGEGG